MRVYTSPAAKAMKPKHQRRMKRLLAKRIAQAQKLLAQMVARSIYVKD